MKYSNVGHDYLFDDFFSFFDCRLVGNPICQGNGAAGKYCKAEDNNSSIQPSNNCASISCSSNKILSPNCICSFPYTGTVHFFSVSFSDLQNISYYRTLAGSLISVLRANGVPVDSVNLSNPSIDVYSYLQFGVQIFPSGQDSFNRTAISTISFVLNRQLFQIQYFGPLFFTDEKYCCFAGNYPFSTQLGDTFMHCFFSFGS